MLKNLKSLKIIKPIGTKTYNKGGGESRTYSLLLIGTNSFLDIGSGSRLKV